CFHIREKGELVASGIFYEPGSLTKRDIKLIKRFAQDAELTPPYRPVLALTPAQFVPKIFFPTVYELDALCVGVNLPFVLSRLAIGYRRARRGVMHGGFSFALSKDKTKPRLRIKHLNKRAAFIQFAKLGRKSAHGRGYFLDALTLEA